MNLRRDTYLPTSSPRYGLLVDFNGLASKLDQAGFELIEEIVRGSDFSDVYRVETLLRAALNNAEASLLQSPLGFVASLTRAGLNEGFVGEEVGGEYVG